MSPVLSNIFQNDIHDILSQDECDPVRLYDIYMNRISWADDLLIISHSDYKHALTNYTHVVQNGAW